MKIRKYENKKEKRQQKGVNDGESDPRGSELTTDGCRRSASEHIFYHTSHYSNAVSEIRSLQLKPHPLGVAW